ncbi:hypothetical protein IPM09_04610 [Candidatus Saccharibacteria bacterium]|nr:MAG: hypothetical protein IPM09_04610 [Candidatus Saccharibacteria bacterium]
MGKPRGYDVPPPAEPKTKIVTSVEGRVLESIPKRSRRAAAKAAAAALDQKPWDIAHQSPEALRHQAHMAANSRDHSKPTRALEKRRAISDY